MRRKCLLRGVFTWSVTNLPVQHVGRYLESDQHVQHVGVSLHGCEVEEREAVRSAGGELAHAGLDNALDDAQANLLAVDMRPVLVCINSQD